MSHLLCGGEVGLCVTVRATHLLELGECRVPHVAVAMRADELHGMAGVAVQGVDVEAVADKSPVTATQTVSNHF